MNFFNNVFSVDDAMKQGDTPVDLPCTSDDGTPMSPGDTNIWELPTPRGDEAPVMVGPFANWKVANKYKILRTIGKGSYGEVVEATDERNASQRVAIKRILKIFDSETDAKRIYREIRLNHPNVVALRNVFTGNPLNSPVYSPGIASQPLTPGLGMKNLHLDTTPRKRHRPRAFSIDHSLDDLYLVFDFVDTDLQKLIHSAQYLSSAHVKTFLYQMLVALKYIHSANVIHRDIKPANILLYEDCRLKLCDFGLARIVSSDVATAHTPKRVPVPTGTSSVSNVDDDAMPLPVSRQLTRHVVTRWYRAPELILLSEYTGAVDMWSVGCVFAELLGMQAEIIRDYQDRTALFPGMSCPSLSGDGLEDAAARRRGYRETEIDRSDQLNVILRTLGSPSEEDLEAFGSEHAKRVLRNQPYYAGGGLPNRFKMASRNALDLLQRMLQFNPNKRITVEEALSHRYLSEVRDISMETTMEQGLNVNFETPPLVGELLRKKMKEEIESYEKH